MAAFIVLTLAPQQGLDRKVAEIYPQAHLALSPTAWLVSDVGVTTKDVCDKINIREGGFSGAMVIKIESYFGFAAPNIWEWLKLRITEN
jgi:hypothetical protein